jgi:cytochrome c
MRRIGLAVLVAAGSIAGAAALGIGDAAQNLGAQVLAPTQALAQSDQVAAGQGVYMRACGYCHGDMGEGMDDAPPLVGRASAIGDFRTAARLYNFVASEMPGDDPGSLSSQEYYDVVAYLLAQNGLNPSGQPVNPSTAPNIQL